MGFVLGVLTFTMVIVCMLIVFLVLLQLPKKEAGGLAFGGVAADALFGAGSGTVLTKITKYAAMAFFILAVLVSVLETRVNSAKSSFLRSPPTTSAPR